jgi:WD40 repeat protein
MKKITAMIIAAFTAFYPALNAGVALYRDLSGHTTSVSCVDFSANGAYLASADLSGEVRIWDVNSGVALVTIKHGAPVETLAFSPDSKYIATGARDNTVKLWEVAGGSLVKTFEDFKTPVFSVAFSIDGKMLAGGSYKKIIIWGVKEQKKFQEIGIADSWARSVRFSPDGSRLAAACGSTLRIWKINYNDFISKLLQKGGVSFREVRDIAQGSLVYTTAFSKDSQYIVSAGEGGEIKSWRVEDGYPRWTTEEHGPVIWSLACSPDGKLVSSGGKDSLIRIWDAADGKLINTIVGLSDEVYSVAFSPDNGRLAGGSRDKSVKLWDISFNLNMDRVIRAAAIAGASIILLLFVLIGVKNYRKEKAKVKNWKP